MVLGNTECINIWQAFKIVLGHERTMCFLEDIILELWLNSLNSFPDIFTENSILRFQILT